METKSNMTWYRVTDALSPIYGCDVRGYEEYSDTYPDTLRITAMRRVDLLVGNRPFQLVAKEGEDLGLWIRLAQLNEAPIQDETVEMVYDRPYGICLDESEMKRKDGVVLRIARYEHATQISVEDRKYGLLRSTTDTGNARDVFEAIIVKMFEEGREYSDIVYALEN